MFNQLFKDTLKQAFDIEKDAAYNGHRIPEYQEITKSANDLLRASMFAFTSIYVANSREKLFDAVTLRNKTANGDNEIIKGGRVWDMVQKSVKESPNLHLRSIANKWLAEKNSYEAMTNELNAIFANKNNKTQDVIDLRRCTQSTSSHANVILPPTVTGMGCPMPCFASASPTEV